MKRRIACVGGGAMGSLVAARLASLRGDAPAVSLVSRWTDHLNAIRDQNGTLACRPASSANDRLVAPVTALDAGAEETLAKALHDVDVVFLWVKGAEQTQRAVQLAQSWSPRIVCCLQNGLAHLPIVRSAFPDAVLGTTTISARMSSTLGEVIETSQNDYQTETTLLYGKRREACETIRELWNKVKVFGTTRIVNCEEDFTKALWTKLLVNVAVNPIAAICGFTNGELLENSSAMQVAFSAAREVVNIAPVDAQMDDLVDVEALIEKVLTRTKMNTSSMLADKKRGIQPTELDAIVGPILHRAEELGRPAPVCETLYRILKCS